MWARQKYALGESVHWVVIYVSSPLDAHSHLIPTFPITSAPTSKSHRMGHEARIQAAITDLESQTRRNYASTARK